MSWKVFASSAQKLKPRVPERTRIYAIGDVHGRVDLLSALFDQIDDHIDAFPIKRPIQVLLGDYIDRGPNSREVIDTLIARRSRHGIICLKGNHESYAAQILADPSVLPEWSQFGGANTLLSYGVRPPIRDNLQQQEEAALAFRQALPESHHRFLNSLALSFTSGDYFFAHAGVRPGIPLHEQNEEDLLSIRREFLQHEKDYSKIVVHGHTPVKEPEFRQNRINIDTGAYATGRLTCLTLEGDEIAIMP